MEFKNYFFLLLKEATREDIRKYYPKISDKDYNTILDGDKTGAKNKVGNLGRLVLDLYKKDQFDINSEMLRDVYVAFGLIQKKKNSLIGTEFEKFRDLSAVPDTKVLMDVNHYLSQLDSKKIKLKATDGQNTEIFYEDESWVIKIPLDYMASVRLGREYKASWCTASSNATFHYNRYVAKDDLYIFISKHTNEAYQYFDHITKIEFNDIKNKPVNLEKFIGENKLQGALAKIQAESKKIQNNKSYRENRFLKRYEQTKSPYIVLAALEISEGLVDSLLKIHKPDLDKEFPISIGAGGSKVQTTLNFEFYLNDSKHTTLVYNKELIKGFCEKFDVENYTINSDLTVSVKGDLYWVSFNIKRSPIKFKEVQGSFICRDSEFTSLKGFPQIVGEDFDCRFNNLKSLEGCPEVVGRDFFCGANYLKSLEGCPKVVGRVFYCGDGFSSDDVEKLCDVKGWISETVDEEENEEFGYDDDENGDE